MNLPILKILCQIVWSFWIHLDFPVKTQYSHTLRFHCCTFFIDNSSFVSIFCLLGRNRFTFLNFAFHILHSVPQSHFNVYIWSCLCACLMFNENKLLLLLLLILLLLLLLLLFILFYNHWYFPCVSFPPTRATSQSSDSFTMLRVRSPSIPVDLHSTFLWILYDLAFWHVSFLENIHLL